MDKIRCVPREVQKGPDPKLNVSEHPVEEEVEHEKDEENVGQDEEEEDSHKGNTEEEEDSDEGWDENGEPCLPFISTWEKPEVFCNAGPSYTVEQALDIVSSSFAWNAKLSREWREMVDNNRTPLPVQPLYVLPKDSIGTVIEVLAEAEHSSDVRFSAVTSGIDDEIELYDGTFCGRGTILKHVVAVKKQEELDVVLKTNDGSLYKWTFQAGVGVLAAPEHRVSGFGQYFVMNVSFRTRGKAASAWQWSCICNDVRVTKTCL